MRLTVIGCAGSFPGPNSAASCYLVEAPYDGRTYRLLLDLGSGALGTLQRYVDLRSINAVALSHLHPDHCLDLLPFYVVRKYHPDGAWPPLPVWGPTGTAERLARAYDGVDAAGMAAQLDTRSYPDEPFDVGPFRLEVARVDHPVLAYAVRVSWSGRSLVYSGDTGPCAALDELASRCDLLLAEASFLERPDGPPNPAGLHLTGRQAAETASRAGAGALVLTHIPAWHDPAVVLTEARPHFDGSVELARSGATYDLRPLQRPDASSAARR